MTRLIIPICVGLLTSLTTAHADAYLYACKVGNKTAPLVVDDAKNTILWENVEYDGIVNAMEDDPPSCARMGWRVSLGENTFNFCTATKGWGAIETQGKVKVTCNLQSTFTVQATFDNQSQNDNPPPTTAKPAVSADPIADAIKNSPPPNNESAVNKLLSRMAGSDGRPARMIGPDEYHPSHPVDPEPAPSPSNQELSCASQEVRKILYDGTLGKTLGYVEAYRKRIGNNGSPAAIALEEVSHWRGKVVNIREISREPGSVSCAAEFEWQNLPSKQSLGMVGMILLTEGIRDESCIKINYKVQPLLDKPGQFYASWRCNDG